MARFGVWVQLMTVLLAAIGATHLWGQGGRLRRGIVLALLAWTAFEQAPFPPWRWHHTLPTAGLRWVAAQPGPLVLLDCRSVREPASHALAHVMPHPVRLLGGPLGHVAKLLSGEPVRPVVLVPSCSGAEAFALCLGAILAFPVRWRRRLVGASLGLAFLVGLNVLRLATLMLAVESPALYRSLHLYVWPAVLLVAAVAYVGFWMLRATGQVGGALRPPPIALRFLVLTGVLVAAFVAAAPWYLASPLVAALGELVARISVSVMSGLGMAVEGRGNLLVTPQGVFAVTQECIATPLIPVYLAAVLSLPLRRRTRLFSLLGTAPLFVILGVLRLLVLGLPREILPAASLAGHGFNQLFVGVAAVVAVAFWRRPPTARIGATLSRAAGALGAGTAAGLVTGVSGSLLVRLAAAASGLLHEHAAAWHLPDDGQGALALLPPSQVGLLVALWVAASSRPGWPRLLAGVAVLGATQLVLLIVFGEAWTHLELAPHPRWLRAWAVAAPLALAWVLLRGPDLPARDPSPETPARASHA